MSRPLPHFAVRIGSVSAVALVIVASTSAMVEAKGFKLKLGGSSHSVSKGDHVEGEAAAAIGRAATRAYLKSRRSGSEETADGTKGTSASPSLGTPPDYWTKRAQRLIEAETGHLQGPHPLQLAHPGMDVVVCEAGCSTDRAEIVYLQPTTKAPEPVATATSAAAGAPDAGVGAAASPAAAPATAAADAGAAPAAARPPRPYMIVCEGGCYDTPRTYRAAQSRVAAGTSTDWVSTVTPTSAAPEAPARSESGRWLRNIDGEAPADTEVRD
ncbi:MAG: hypothetical protein AB7E80_03250 [Hyphomicrobiaceae bacterium]